ncbi:MAG: group II intron reverse transcriptase/maturase [Deltaproteobacteria bacterium]|nr:group II intron reverse transcriptase/maturase [Deltaproteobacteria bacterium]
MRREQKTATAGCPGEDRLEVEDNRGVRSVRSDEGGTVDQCQTDLMEQILDGENLDRAYRKVKENKGAPGIDKMTVEELLPYLKRHKDEIVGKILNGSYRPKPVRRVEIPKPDGGVRLLGVPTVLDRFVQQATAQVLSPIFEETFSEYSYGFRPERSAHDALLQVKRYFDEGYEYVVDIDLAKYFDTVNHDKLINMLREVVKDERVIRLIRRFLISGVMIGGLVHATEEGVPQGGPLSPLLSNIYLTKFDRILEDRGLRFARYADDCNIYVKSQRAAERVMVSATNFLEKTLKLKVNQDKSQVGSPKRLKFLGFTLWKIKDKSGIGVHKKSKKRFQDKVRKITKRNRGRSIDAILGELKRYTVGWLAYYRLANMKSWLNSMDSCPKMMVRNVILTVFIVI